jgi:DNA replication protein DnaC
MALCRKSVDCDERASLIVTSHKPVSAWREIFRGDDVVAAMIDRLVHHFFQHAGA